MTTLPKLRWTETGEERLQRVAWEDHELWVAETGGHPAFACWIFRGRAPVAAAKGHWIDLPSPIVCLAADQCHRVGRQVVRAPGHHRR